MLGNGEKSFHLLIFLIFIEDQDFRIPEKQEKKTVFFLDCSMFLCRLRKYINNENS